jgi:ABC-type phosphonate transport system ATPase subunit
MIDDMQSKSFVFVGARLNEPPFYHYINLRSQRSKGTKEVRAKAFLVAPAISTIRRRQLEDQNIVVIEATTQEFFETISTELRQRIPNRIDLLSNMYPHQISAIKSGHFDSQADLLRQFEFVSTSDPVPSRTTYKTTFFEGAEPTWEDVRQNVDAHRSVTTDVLDALKNPTEGISSFILVGHAGSGKSTILRRLAYELARERGPVYFLKSPYRIEKDAVLKFINSIGNRHIYMFVDDAIFHLEGIDEIITESVPGANITLVLADRPHVIYPRLRSVKALKPSIIEMPLLNRDDCERMIDKLKEFGLLGALQGKARTMQIQEFLGRSKKQLLVAMKEATLGKGFDAILVNEFQSLSGVNARSAYTVACLAYMHGAPVRRRHLLACMEGTDIEKSNILANDLREVVVWWKDREDILCPRHRVIAHQVATETAPFDLKETAVLNFLSQISGDITPQNISKRTPEYIAYRGIINFDNMLTLFGEDYDVIGRIYSELKNYYPEDFLFWLQFGRAEIYFDNFDAAENYLKQSLGIREKGNFQARHHKGVLYLKRACFQDNPASAASDARQGEETLREQIRERGDLDAYPYAAIVTHKLRYLKKWTPAKTKEELEDLYKLAQIGIQKHPSDEAMIDAHQEIFRQYLAQAVKTS